MQIASPKIWTRVTVSISSNKNHYPTGASVINVHIFIYIYKTRSTSKIAAPFQNVFNTFPANSFSYL